MQHDRKHNLNAEEATSAPAEDHGGERKPDLAAKSLAGRGDAPDGSEDDASQGGQADGPGGE